MLNLSGVGRRLPREAAQAAFPLGGIGTGNVSLGARGEFRDWEIWNRPGKGNVLPYTFFALWCRPAGGEPRAKILAARPLPPYTGAHGFDPSGLAGLPHFAWSEMTGEYPLVRVELRDEEMPVRAVLTACTPLIPLDPDESGLPGLILHYRLENLAAAPLEVALAGSLTNAVGFTGYGPTGLRTDGWRDNLNRLREEDGLIGLDLIGLGQPADAPAYGCMTLATPAGDYSAKPAWYRGRWWAGAQEFWEDFRTDGRLTDFGYDESWAKRRFETGSLARHARLEPGETDEFTFYLTWYFPNRPACWDGEENVCTCGDQVRTVRNHYARQFASAWEVASYLHANLARLEGATQAFHDALFQSTLPEAVIDAAAASIAVVRSPTCLWLADGTFLGYEGCHDTGGCCPGNCTHVWNYAQTVAFLFPSLERSMREQDFLLETDERGRMNFRARHTFPVANVEGSAATDGQLGTILRLFREWRLSGDGEFLRRLWPQAELALDYAIRTWDADGDGMLEAEQPNTYDISFFGPQMLTGALLLGASRAGALMAEAAGRPGRAADYRALESHAAAAYEAALWNGEYYRQAIGDADAKPFQFGEGCLADQLFGQTLAHLFGLGDLLPREHLRRALAAIHRHNFRPDLGRHEHVQRVYATDGEAGLVLCTWPRGGRPRFPLVYADEVWTGVEYQVATELVYQGLLEEAFSVVRAARDRYDGYKRNPWDEIECGHHYARSMAGWGLPIALSGFGFDLARGEISFSPSINADDFRCLWTTGRGWGIYRQRRETSGEIVPEVIVLGGEMSGVRVKAAGREWILP